MKKRTINLNIKMIVVADKNFSNGGFSESGCVGIETISWMVDSLNQDV